MRKLTITLCLTLAVFLGSSGASWSANYNEELDAAKIGDHSTALREWKPLAEQGYTTDLNRMSDIKNYGGNTLKLLKNFG